MTRHLFISLPRNDNELLCFSFVILHFVLTTTTHAISNSSGRMLDLFNLCYVNETVSCIFGGTNSSQNDSSYDISDGRRELLFKKVMG